MIKLKKWLEKLYKGCLHEKIILFSFGSVLLVLSFDCWFKNLPISGYALIFFTLLLIGCTTWGTCHGIKWLLHCNKPLKLYITDKSQNEKLQKILGIISRAEDAIFDKIFFGENKEFSSPFNYPTTLNEQIGLFLKDTERDFVKPWYSEISKNPSFLFDIHLLLEEVFFKVIEKLKRANCKNLILSILMLYLNHLQEYKKSMKKIAKLKNAGTQIDPNSGCNELIEPKKIELCNVYRYAHPGSQSDQMLNYVLRKVTKWILQEYAPHEFVVSIQCKILTSILARKVLRTCLSMIEDPKWIYIKLIHLIDSEKYNKLMENKTYSVTEQIVEEPDDNKEFHYRRPLLFAKSYMKSNILQNKSNAFDKNNFSHDKLLKSSTNEADANKKVEKENLNLPVQNENSFMDGQGRHITSVLGGIISSTAGPLLPDNVSLCYEPLNKMWLSPVVEKKPEITSAFALPFGRGVVEGMKIENRKSKYLSRSKSTESISPLGDINEPLRVKDISIGEELCESVRFATKDDIRPGDIVEEEHKVSRSKKLVKTRSFDTGSVAIDSSEVAFEPAVVPSASEVTAIKEAGSVSPVYEEPEDFATTIAKLRSLLQQRESSSTLSDKSVQSIDLPSSASNVENSESSNKTQSTDLENSSFDSQVASDIPTDGRLFMNVCIPKTEVVTDNSGNQHVLYSIQYDGIYMLKEPSPTEEPELVLQTTVVKRKFQEFLTLQIRLEECSYLKLIMKGIKGPPKSLNVPFSGKGEEVNSIARKSGLELYLQQLCSKIEICAAPELHEFLGYGSNGNKMFVKKDQESSVRRIDKLLTNKITGMFNTIKTALPSFDFDSASSVAIADSKISQDQKILPGFLNFGNKTEEYVLNFDFEYKEPTGDALTDDIRRYLNEKSDCVDDAMDVLDSNDWLRDKRECRPISSEGKCVWHGYKDHLEDDVDQLDSWLPVYSVILDIFCELLQESDCWAIKEPIVRLIKVLTGHWELEIQKRLSKWDWDQIIGNVIRLLRTAIFQPSSSSESTELDVESTKSMLKDAILKLMPNFLAQCVNPDGLTSAITLFIDSFQNFRTNRDVLLRLLDVLLVQLLSCRHLSCDDT